MYFLMYSHMSILMFPKCMHWPRLGQAEFNRLELSLGLVAGTLGYKLLLVTSQHVNFKKSVSELERRLEHKHSDVGCRCPDD